MKLISCDIENFGKLSNYHFEFNNGLNTIKKENGFGKSTLADFIKAMFYGMETKKNTKVLLDRKKYEPWQGGAFGGSLIFELNSKNYKIERFFGKKENDDTFKLYDLSTNLESKDFTANIGEEIFKINKEGFERSIFISGQNIETSMNDSISAKLGNILENENDINTSEKALRVLDEAIKIYKKTGNRGKINEKIAEKTLLEEKLKQSEIDEKNLAERKKQNEDISKELKELQEKNEKYQKCLKLKIEGETKKAKLENYKILQESVEECEKKQEELLNFFKNDIPEDNEIDALINECVKLEKYKSEIKNYEVTQKDADEIKRLDGIFKDNIISEENIDNKISFLNDLKDSNKKIDLLSMKKQELEKDINETEEKIKKNKIFIIILLIIGIILCIVGIAIFKKSEIEKSLVIPVLGLVCSFYFIIKSFKLKKEFKKNFEKKQQCEEIEKTLNEISKENEINKKEIESYIYKYSEPEESKNLIIQLTKIKTEFVKYKELKKNIYNQFNKQNEVISKLRKTEEEIQKTLNKYYKDLINPYISYAQEIKMKKIEIIKIKEEIEQKSQNKIEFENTNNIEKLGEQPYESIVLQEISKSELEERIREISEKINTLNDEKNYIRNQIEMLESNLDTVLDIENEIEEVKEQINEMNYKSKILEKTKKYLNEAKEQFSAHYMGGMKKNFLNNLKLVNGENLNAFIDVNLNVQLEEQGANKEMKYFSTGYKDIIYICMRLSLIQALYENEKPFIILDDPFINLDEKKVENALELIEKISNEYQIIYFVCHKSRVTKE